MQAKIKAVLALKLHSSLNASEVLEWMPAAENQVVQDRWEDSCAQTALSLPVVLCYLGRQLDEPRTAMQHAKYLFNCLTNSAQLYYGNMQCAKLSICMQ